MRNEYKIVHTQTEMTSSQLNSLSNQGWELVSVIFVETMLSYYFRKERNQITNSKKTEVK